MSLSHASLTWEYFPELIYDIEKNIKRNCVSYFTRECVLQIQKIRDEPWYEYEYTKTEKCSVVSILVERKVTRGSCNSRRETFQHPPHNGRNVIRETSSWLPARNAYRFHWRRGEKRCVRNINLRAEFHRLVSTVQRANVWQGDRTFFQQP